MTAPTTSQEAWERYLLLLASFINSARYMNPASADFGDYLSDTEQAHIDWLYLKVKEEENDKA